MKKLFMVIIGVAMMPGFALANTYDSSATAIDSGTSYDTQNMDEVREQEMREDEMRREELRQEESKMERTHDRYDVDVENLKSDPVSGASAPRYNTDENSGYR